MTIYPNTLHGHRKRDGDHCFARVHSFGVDSEFNNGTKGHFVQRCYRGTVLPSDA